MYELLNRCCVSTCVTLKGNSIDCTYQTLFTGPVECYYIREKNGIKPFVAPEGAVRSLVNYLK